MPNTQPFKGPAVEDITWWRWKANVNRAVLVLTDPTFLTANNRHRGQ